MFQTILIANRGEIACRITKTAQRMGITVIAVYSEADSTSLHVQLADKAYCLGAPKASESYLNIDKIIHIAKEHGAEAIHPGYGFLSEHPLFAKACMDAGIVFIGPSISAMEAMASKQTAKQLLEHTNVPLIPGYHGKEQSDKHLLQEAERIGFPVLLKAAMGGGGKGMRVVEHQSHFLNEVQAARREAKAYFADDTLLIERFIKNPRHVEIQIMADHYGNVVHLFERDCSIQRRHQKIIEEARAFGLSENLRKRLGSAAITVANTIQYLGAGTIEFLVSEDEQFYFMEMNTRLQVEHPVTEMITGMDLVEWQLRIAAKEHLPCTHEEIHCHGHAIECRVYAEDPEQNFLPSVGTISFLREPKGEGIRIDSGIQEHSSISVHYDPMISKLITWGQTRKEAIHRMMGALNHYAIGGVKTNLAFLQAIIQHPAFIEEQISTDFLNKHTLTLSPIPPQEALYMAACVDFWRAQHQHDPLFQDTFAWHAHLKPNWRLHYLIEGKQYSASLHPIDANRFLLQTEHQEAELSFEYSNGALILQDGEQKGHVWVEDNEYTLHFYQAAKTITVERFCWQTLSINKADLDRGLTAPMHGTIVSIFKNKGDTIKAGERLIIMEAMKMEHTIYAPKDGILIDVFYPVGAQVHEGTALVAIE